MTQRFLKTGEFAAFCNTTKDTLFYYDAIGLLKPVRTAANGYRYYALNQLYMFDLITTLKELGLPLQDIKSYMDGRDTDAFVELLKEQDKRLKEKIDVFMRRRRLLRNTLAITGRAFEEEEGVISIRQLPEEYFIVSDRPRGNSEKELWEVISRLWDYCNKHNAYDDFVTGELIELKDVQNGSFNIGFYTSRISKKIKSRYLHVKPAGLYAVKYVRSSYDDLPQEFAAFCSGVAALGYAVRGGIYQNDITNYLSEQHDDEYLMSIEARVERA